MSNFSFTCCSNSKYTVKGIPAKPLLCMLNSGGFFLFLRGHNERTSTSNNQKKSES